MTQSSSYSPLEERLNTMTHGISVVLSLIGFYLLLEKSDTSIQVLANSIYSASLVILFSASTLYHWVDSPASKKILKLVDHSAIYVLIAGTYTPYTLISLSGWVAWLATSSIWAIALFGILVKTRFGFTWPKLSVALYLVMGWLAVLLVYPLYQVVPSSALLLLLYGGLSFTFGVGFYVAKSYQFTHAIWHVFVSAGCACHFFSIYLYVN